MADLYRSISYFSFSFAFLKTIFAEGFDLLRSSSATAGEMREKESAALMSVAIAPVRTRFAMGKSVEEIFVNLL
jgi:hypothetical protein